MPVYANVTAAPGSGWAELLEFQLKCPVRWTETVQRMVGDGFTTFVEFGSGEVLCGLIRRIDGEAKTMAIHDPGGLEAAVEALQDAKVEA